MSAVQDIHVPREWEQLKLARLHGLLLVIGATDIGKSTFARYLYQRLCLDARRVAYLDGDPGQSTLGPPATMTLALNQPGQAIFPPQGQTWRSFVGAVSPRGHMLPLLVGASRLAVFPAPHFSLNQLVALESAAGFALGLGIVQQHDVKASQVVLYTPLNSLAEVDALNLGDVAVEPGTYRDQLQNVGLKVPRLGSVRR